MKKFNYKSRKGFTLIELLVVIGILAVLAAIAIPSVAGLIDRANASADNTNANEMTNAMERFVSEYELYKQDIASGAIKDGDGDGVPDNMDAAQGRVYNVTKAVTRSDIEKLESLAGFNGIRIDIDNKYAQNHETAKAVMQNYMKTSSSTFEPKQSDMTYWYNTVTGYTVVAEKYVNTETLYLKLPTEVRYEGTTYASVSEWIDLSSDFIIPDCRIYEITAGISPNSGEEAIIYRWEVPDPDYNANINFDNIFYMCNRAENGILSFDNYAHKHSINEALNGKPFSKDGDVVRFNGYITFSTSNDPTIRVQLRLCFRYNDNGTIRYAYSPVFETSLQELKGIN